ncbi:MAG: hypothetical protein KIG39_05580, partial [Lachnospiraceae bacterium]|nr:hypothetical protein [Lachnospiraceae bacterium]
MKKIGIILLTALCLVAVSPVSAKTDKTMKISLGGEVKYAKDIGEGKGINIVLPELDVDNFYINAIELAVFERQETETEWHVYKDNNGRESKKQYIENPQSLNVSVDFGDIDDYRDRAKYKLAYRYYIQSTDDMSKIFIAGKDTKDGWRLVGEQSPIRATDNGFMFYTNANPEINVQSFSYEKHIAEGSEVVDKTPDELLDVRLPLDAFSNGVTVNYQIDDFDTEDELTVKYVLIDASTETVLASGYLDQFPVIKADVMCDMVKLKLTVCDNFGGETDSEWFTFNIDRQKPFVSDEFDDLGYMIKGNNLFSDFTIHDDSGILMTEGSVYVTINFGDDVYDSEYLEYMNDGIYRLDREVTLDGKYKIELDMYDKAGNIGHHVFYQTLDNTEPTAEFVSDMVNTNATKYSTWMNVSKSIIINARDNMSGVIKYMIYLDNSRDKQESFQLPVSEYTIINPVTDEKTGKLKYSGNIFDNAKTIDKKNNRADESSEGNRLSFEKYVWLDKTPPVIECDVDETMWYESPAVFNINILDTPSSAFVNDASGIATREYAITDSMVLPTEWNTYNGYVEVNEGGVFYIQLKAVDNAGNEATLTKKVRTNAASMLLGRVEPTDDYLHTIYYRETDFYVIKNTAYNTKFHFLLKDTDTEDGIQTDVRLVSK